MLRRTIRYIGPPHGTGTLPRPVVAKLAQTGGIVSTRELRELGVDQVTLELYRLSGALQSVRQGWYCSPATPAILRLAWRFGGPLACTSALQFHAAVAASQPSGEPQGEQSAGQNSRQNTGQSSRQKTGPSRGPIPLTEVHEPLHICLPSDGVAPPLPSLLAERWGIPEPQQPVIHWNSRDYTGGDRRAVSRDAALRHVDHCQALGRLGPSPALP